MIDIQVELNPAVLQPDFPAADCPLTAAQLRALGVAPHKIPRVQKELARLAPALRGRASLPALALSIAKALP